MDSLAGIVLHCTSSIRGAWVAFGSGMVWASSELGRRLNVGYLTLSGSFRPCSIHGWRCINGDRTYHLSVCHRIYRTSSGKERQ
jgi:hypothetical protein